MRNKPASKRLRQKYKDIGFVDDDPDDPESAQTFDFSRPGAMELALVVIQSIYDDWGIPFTDPP